MYLKVARGGKIQKWSKRNRTIQLKNCTLRAHLDRILLGRIIMKKTNLRIRIDIERPNVP